MLHVLFSMEIADLSHVLFYIQGIEWIIRLQFSLFCLSPSFLPRSQRRWVITMLACHVPYSVHGVPNETRDRPVMLTLLIDIGLLHLIGLSRALFSTPCTEWNTWQASDVDTVDWYRSIAPHRPVTCLIQYTVYRMKHMTGRWGRRRWLIQVHCILKITCLTYSVHGVLSGIQREACCCARRVLLSHMTDKVNARHVTLMECYISRFLWLLHPSFLLQPRRRYPNYAIFWHWRLPTPCWQRPYTKTFPWPDIDIVSSHKAASERQQCN